EKPPLLGEGDRVSGGRVENVLFKTKGKIMRNFYFRPLANVFSKRSAAIYYLCSWSGFLLGDKLRPLIFWGSASFENRSAAFAFS
ncbi:MAG: hypothetical protein ACI4IT_05400, partial [Oscillospiraceae bacterium]